MDISGHQRFAHRFARAYANAGKKLRASLKYRVNKIFEQTQIFVPVDTGELKSSGKIITTQENDKTSSYIIRYGEGASKEYAFWVEVREYTKNNVKVKHDPPTQAWYVRDAHNMHIEKLKEDMAERVKQLRKEYKLNG